MSRKLLVVFGCSIGFALLFMLMSTRPITSIQAATLSDQSVPPIAFGGPPIDPSTPDVIVSSDDRDNATPTGWWTYSGQTASDIDATLAADNARIVDIQLEAVARPHRFTATYVANTGAYQKTWWWYYDVDETALNNALSANNARLIALKAYDIGSGQIRFAAVMIANTAADAKSWWWYYNKSVAELTTLWQANTARLSPFQPRPPSLCSASSSQLLDCAACRSNCRCGSRTRWCASTPDP